ncbi:1789_t:CDS:1 [Paraglomus brasilianum]|uniref:1789_t:CDS:1 n=1 Tax=Paraglomus brasilianum TaxID=144538 RepID=A0A9N9AMA6_9GLOM|nr:1789_t:CDS:1 [Paraglomus brasilianum]
MRLQKYRVLGVSSKWLQRNVRQGVSDSIRFGCHTQNPVTYNCFALCRTHLLTSARLVKVSYLCGGNTAHSSTSLSNNGTVFKDPLRYYTTQGTDSTTDKPNPTPFDVLGLPHSASTADVKGRYYELVKQYHPDKVGHNSPAALNRFRNVVKAYELLSNPKSRELYLRYGIGWIDTSFMKNTIQNNSSYKSGPRYAHVNTWGRGEAGGKPIYISNIYFAAFLVTAAIFCSMFQFLRAENSISSIRLAQERHNLQASKDLARARQQGKKYARQRKAALRLMYNQSNGYKDDNNICNSGRIVSDDFEVSINS